MLDHSPVNRQYAESDLPHVAATVPQEPQHIRFQFLHACLSKPVEKPIQPVVGELPPPEEPQDLLQNDSGDVGLLEVDRGKQGLFFLKEAPVLPEHASDPVRVPDADRTKILPNPRVKPPRRRLRSLRDAPKTALTARDPWSASGRAAGRSCETAHRRAATAGQAYCGTKPPRRSSFPPLGIAVVAGPLHSTRNTQSTTVYSVIALETS
jgi:hypothetical protein